MDENGTEEPFFLIERFDASLRLYPSNLQSTHFTFHQRLKSQRHLIEYNNCSNVTRLHVPRSSKSSCSSKSFVHVKIDAAGVLLDDQSIYVGMELRAKRLCTLVLRRRAPGDCWSEKSISVAHSNVFEALHLS